MGSRLGPNAIESWKHPRQRVPANVLDRGLVSEKGQGRVGTRGGCSSGKFGGGVNKERVGRGVGRTSHSQAFQLSQT